MVRQAASIELLRSAAIVAVPDIATEGTDARAGQDGAPSRRGGGAQRGQSRRGGRAHHARSVPASRASAARRPRRCSAVGAAGRPE